MINRQHSRLLDEALTRLIAGGDAAAVAASMPGEVRPYVELFARLQAEAVPAPSDDFRLALRARLVGRARAQVSRPATITPRLQRVAAAGVASIVLGSAVNPALAHELVEQIRTTMGESVAEVVSRALSHVNPPASPETAEAQPTAPDGLPAGLLRVIPGNAPEVSPGVPAGAPAAPEVRTSAVPAPAAPPAGTGTDSGDAHENVPGNDGADTVIPTVTDVGTGVPGGTRKNPVAPITLPPVTTPSGVPAAGGSGSTTPPSDPGNPGNPGAGGEGTPSQPDDDGPGGNPPGDPPGEGPDDPGNPDPAGNDPQGPAAEIPDHANGGNRDTALDHAAGQGNKTGWENVPEDPGNAPDDPPGLARQSEDPGPPAHSAAGGQGKPTDTPEVGPNQSTQHMSMVASDLIATLPEKPAPAVEPGPPADGAPGQGKDANQAPGRESTGQERAAPTGQPEDRGQGRGYAH